MDKQELKKILDEHKKWFERREGIRPDLKNADLKNADLQNADLQNTDLRGADLRNANLRNANLKSANLKNANLRHADLRSADLWNADLKNADLRNANLKNVNLRHADLRGADLRGADLDLSCLQLWYESFDMIVDERVAAQIAYHFCRLKCDSDEFIKARNAIIDFANKFHRAKDCGKLEEIGGKNTEVTWNCQCGARYKVQRID